MSDQLLHTPDSFILYRIYYGDSIVYVGRTKQPLQDRIRGHLFKKPMLREIDITQVSKIEYTALPSEADMYLYEIYYINLWHPGLNKDDKAKDALTITLPERQWELFTTPLWDKWKEELARKDEEEAERRRRKVEAMELDHKMRRMLHTGEITESDYWAFRESIARGADVI